MTQTHTLPRTAALPVPRAARLVFGLLETIVGGTLAVTGPDGTRRYFGDGAGAPVRIALADWKVLERCLAGGDIGFAETYMEGRWHTDDIAALVALFSRNRAAMEKAVYGSVFGGLLYRLNHLLNRNTRSRAKKNIEAHYDLGNDFYALWLDPSMTYSSALFDGDCSLSLDEAQAAKYRRILDKLAPRPGERILEIGCGWGGFAEIAAREYGAQLTCLSLSREQLAFARQRLERAGAGGFVDLQLRDYRDLDGQFDHIVSIEMFEAVGEAYWDAYFACIRRNLKPGGRALVQSITIDERLFDRYRRGTDFIQQYIFPGGTLPSPAEFRARAARAGLVSKNERRFGGDYAETLKRWRVRFLDALPEVRRLGFDERFIRLWEFYLAYCEGAFNAGSTDVIQFELAPVPSAQ